MVNYSVKARKVVLYATAVIAGICIYAALASLWLQGTIFNNDLHKRLFEKYSIYEKVYKDAQEYLENYLKTIKTTSTENQSQQKHLFTLAEKAITPGLIINNLNTMLDGILEYCKGETHFLPDIHLKLSNDSISASDGTNAINSQLQDIDKVNLGVILMYLDRSDITDKLMVMKLLEFVLSRLPTLSFLVFLFSLMTGMASATKKEHVRLWFGAMLSVMCIMIIISIIVSSIFNNIINNWSNGLANPSFPLLSEALPFYARDIVHRYIVYLSLTGLLSFALIIIYTLYSKTACNTDSPVLFKLICRYKKHICSFVLLLLSVFFIINLHLLKEDFHLKNLSIAIDRMKGITAFSRVVYAQDAAIYSLELRFTDKKTESPIAGIKAHIIGKATNSGKAYEEYITSGFDGKVRTELGTGSFKLDFRYVSFPDEYIMPSPYYFEVTKPGVTIITIKLEESEAKKPEITDLSNIDSAAKSPLLEHY